MIIEKKLLDKWVVLRSPEDTGELAKIVEGGYPELFNRAFRQGRCSDKVFKAMAKYYAQKAKLVKQYL